MKTPNLRKSLAIFVALLSGGVRIGLLSLVPPAEAGLWEN